MRERKMNIKITSDSTCDLNKDILDRFNVSVVPLNVVMGNESFVDGVSVTPEDIFAFVEREKQLPKTAAPSVNAYEDFFETLLKSYDHIIHYSLSSKISSSYDNACLAAKRFEKRVTVVDSLALCSGQGLLVLTACDLVADGRTPEEIVDITSAIREDVVVTFVPDSLDYLHKGGRCSLASLIGATVLKLHPLIAMRDGDMFVKKKYMGNLDACIKKYVADLAQTYPLYKKERAIITTARLDDPLKERFIQAVKDTFDFEEILFCDAGSTITSHCGKNTFALFFIKK